MKNKLQVNNLVFNYNNKNILNNISFNSSNGITAVLGHNGAGKTTLMKILTGLKKAKSGTILLNNVDLLSDKKMLVNSVGYLPQNFEIYPNITGLDFLSYICNIKGLTKVEKKEQIESLIEIFNLNKVITKNFHSYSGGYKRRLGIAQALIGNPKLLIIDEPTVGLDPEQRYEFRNYLSKIGNDRIILISTHIIEDIEFYCNNILILNNGNLTFKNTPNELIKLSSNKIYNGYIDISIFNEMRKDFKIIEQVRSINDTIYVKAICENNIPCGFTTCSPSLEDAYVYYQGI